MKNKVSPGNHYSADDVTIDLQQAAAFLHMSPAVLRQKARRGIVKGAKPGKCWMFLKSDLVLYLHSLYSTHDCYQSEQTPCSDWKEVSPCHSLSAAIPGGLDLPLPNGQPVRRSAQTANKQQAQEFHDRLKTECWRAAKLGDKPRRKWQEAVERWLTEKQGAKATINEDVRYLRWLHPFLGELFLEDINRELIDHIAKARMADNVSNTTVNRMLETLRAILNCAEKNWEWLDKAPHVRMLPKPKRRVRWLSKREAERLLMELPEHLAKMMRFTLATGLRQANVTGLLWSQVDMPRACAWIHPDQAKAGKAIPVPLNEHALIVLKRQLNKHDEFVFSYKGKPVTKANNHAWRKALKRVGIADFRWHDLRHIWASWYVQQGTPLYVLQELGGWAGPEMVQRYAHLSASHLKEYADKLAISAASF